MQYRISLKTVFTLCITAAWLLFIPFSADARDIDALPLEDRICLALVNTYYQKEQYTADTVAKMKEIETIKKFDKYRLFAYEFEKKYGDSTPLNGYYRIDDPSRHLNEERPGWAFAFTDNEKKIVVYYQIVKQGTEKPYLEVEMLRTFRSWTLTASLQLPLSEYDITQSSRKKDEVVTLIRGHGDRLYEYAIKYKILEFLDLKLAKKDFRTFFLEHSWMKKTPLVKFRLAGLHTIPNLRKDQHALFKDLQVVVDIDMTFKGASGETYTTAENQVFHMMQHHPNKVEGLKIIEFGPTLFDFMKICNQEKPFELVAFNHFNPEQAGSIPQESQLKIKIKPRKLIAPVVTNEGRFVTKTLDISTMEPSEMHFRFGWEIDMAKETTLYAGKSKPVGWLAYVGYGISIVKWGVKEGPGKVLTIIDTGIKLWQGKYWDALINISECTPVQWVWWAKDVGEKFVSIAVKQEAPTEVMLRAEKGLERLGYTSLDKGKSTKEFPLWVNVKTEKLALLDPMGVVHNVVNPPKNFHVAFPQFKLTGANPSGGQFMVFNPDLEGNMPEAGALLTLSLGPERVVSPPPLIRTPVVITLADPDPGGTSAEALYFSNLNTKGTLEFSAVKSPPGMTYITAGRLAFGWEDDKDKMVYQKPYVSLLEGKLRIMNEAGKIGVSYYKKGTSDKINPADIQVGAWVYPKGTVYTIQKQANSTSFDLEVESGAVEVRNLAGDIIDTVSEGNRKRIIFGVESSDPTPAGMVPSREEPKKKTSDDGWDVEIDFDDGV